MRNLAITVLSLTMLVTSCSNQCGEPEPPPPAPERDRRDDILDAVTDRVTDEIRNREAPE